MGKMLKWENKELFTWREEDPITRKILEGGSTLRWVYMQEFRFAKEIKMAGEHTLWALLLSLLALTTIFLSL